MSFWKSVLSVGQSLLNPAGAVIKAVQRDKVFEAAGTANASLGGARNIIENRLDETSQYTADDLQKLLDNRANDKPGSGFDLMSWLKDNAVIVGVGAFGISAMLLMSSNRRRR